MRLSAPTSVRLALRWRRCALVGVPLLALLVAACGGGGGADDSAAQPSGVTAAGEVSGTPAGGGAGGASAAAPDAPSRPSAPELIGLSDWLNSEPLTLAGQGEQGRVVLIDFWTYTCVNCIRTLPFLRDWHEKYAERGLTVLGVHAPEFDFERDPVNVRDAVVRHELGYPVAQDNEMETWSAFGNRFWPAKYLVGADGALRYQHFGEGDYDATELAIRAALEDAGHDVSDVPLGGVEPPALDANAARGITRELYGGYARSYTIQGGLRGARGVLTRAPTAPRSTRTSPSITTTSGTRRGCGATRPRRSCTPGARRRSRTTSRSASWGAA